MVSNKIPLSEALAAEPTLNNPYVIEKLTKVEQERNRDLTGHLSLLVHELKFKYTRPPI